MPARFEPTSGTVNAFTSSLTTSLRYSIDPCPHLDCLRLGTSQEQPIAASVSFVPYRVPRSVEPCCGARVRDGFDMEATVTCRAALDVNLLGVDLQVMGTSFLQQDSRVGACAQVAIWVGMRHMHARHDYNWISVADITRFATPKTSEEAVSIPAGSDFLTSERMIRGISEAGYQPLCFRRLGIDRAILPYVESGIPVILGLTVGDTIGHAVTVIGRVFAKQKNPTNNAIDYVPPISSMTTKGDPICGCP